MSWFIFLWMCCQLLSPAASMISCVNLSSGYNLNLVFKYVSGRESQRTWPRFLRTKRSYFNQELLILKELRHQSCFLKKNWLNFSKSSFPIRLNLLHPQPSLFLIALESTFWCFSSLANHYFKVSQPGFDAIWICPLPPILRVNKKWFSSSFLLSFPSL